MQLSQNVDIVFLFEKNIYCRLWISFLHWISLIFNAHDQEWMYC